MQYSSFQVARNPAPTWLLLYSDLTPALLRPDCKPARQEIRSVKTRIAHPIVEMCARMIKRIAAYIIFPLRLLLSFFF